MEDQEHLGRPAADAADRDQLVDDRLVVHLLPLRHVHRAVVEVARQVAQVLDLARRQAGRAHRRRRRARAPRPAQQARRTGRRPARRSVSQTACAALTEICWPTIERASVVNASPWLCRRPSPNCGISFFITRSRLARCRQASSQYAGHVAASAHGRAAAIVRPSPRWCLAASPCSMMPCVGELRRGCGRRAAKSRAFLACARAGDARLRSRRRSARCPPAGRPAATAAARPACAPSAFSSAAVAGERVRFTSVASSNSTATATGRVEVVVHRGAERGGRGVASSRCATVSARRRRRARCRGGAARCARRRGARR